MYIDGTNNPQTKKETEISCFYSNVLDCSLVSQILERGQGTDLYFKLTSICRESYNHC